MAQVDGSGTGPTLSRLLPQEMLSNSNELPDDAILSKLRPVNVT